MKADWAHVFLSVLPPLPLASPRDEARIAMALRTSCAAIMSRYALVLPLPPLPAITTGRQIGADSITHSSRLILATVCSSRHW